MQLPPASVLVASRNLVFNGHDDTSIDVTVEIFKPYQTDDRTWACAFRIRGLEDEVVRHIFGIDSMQALVLSLHVIPTELKAVADDAGGRFSTAAVLGLDHACSVHLGNR